MITRKYLVLGQIAFIMIVAGALYFVYPHVDYTLSGNVVHFNSENSHILIFSQSPDFSNPKYVNFDEGGYLKLNAGTYYWKPANSFVTGFSKSFTIDSEAVLELRRDNGDISMKNIGNVKINITKSEGGLMVGHIILEPEQSDITEDTGTYVGGEQ
ncbi:MAG: hypothetical protein RL557_725 [archaeon]|jgi:hypothetical protein